jgi:nucleotide-binding universal stress UspA family protein
MRIHIFYATDGSVSARFAQAQILSLPWRPPAHVTVMTAMEVPHPPFTSVIPPARRAFHAALAVLHQDAEDHATEVLDKARLDLEGQVDSVATRMHLGYAGPTIVDMARACRVDLVAVGSRGLGMYKGFLLGSVSDYVAQHAHCPVLVVKTAPKRDRRFLLVLEGPADRERVVGWLRALDLSAGARIHLLKVCRKRKQAPNPEEERTHGSGWIDTDDDFEEWGNSPEVLEILGCHDLPAGAVRVTAEVRYGDPVPEILDAIHELRPELLVLGAKCPQSSAEAPLGKVARKLIDQASCSVLVVRP